MTNAYDYIKESLRKNLKEKLIEFRKQKSIIRVEKPTDIGRARKLGYKDKKGFIIVRVRLKRGKHKRPRPNKGRKTRNLTTEKSLKMNYRWIAEIRAQKKYPSLEVLNSYKVAKDGKYYWFEVIMVDPNRDEIKKDKIINWICSNKNRKRALRGLTSAAKKARGLR
ncbi:MAG: 50S ribosomal protein L15e [Candidatus Pacearchaeota archaeon]